MSRLLRYLSAVTAAIHGTLTDPVAAMNEVRQSSTVDLGAFPGYWGCYGMFSRAAKEHNARFLAAKFRLERIARNDLGRHNTPCDLRWAQ